LTHYRRPARLSGIVLHEVNWLIEESGKDSGAMGSRGDLWRSEMRELYCLNVGCADATVIISDNCTFLVDCHDIESYTHLLPASKQIRGVFITHQHRNHYSGLDYLRQKGFSINCLIYSPYQRRHGDASVSVEEWNEFNSHCEYFKSNGTGLYAPRRQSSYEKPFWDIDGVKFWMLGPDESIASSDTAELHDASLVFRADLGERKCTFTGDASDVSLNYIAKNTTNICGDILHASHHGSLNGADLDFIRKCNIQFTVISTAGGIHESIPDATALRRYADNTAKEVYRTDKDGSIKCTF
jgi:beta-lactamase superfamily II metal-dependent hydrolase